MIIISPQQPEHALRQSYNLAQIPKVEYKTVNDVSIKPNQYQTTIVGLGSFYHYVDKQNDVVLPNAFDLTLQQWGEKKKLPHMLLEHKYSQVIGQWTNMHSDDNALHVEGQLLSSLPFGKQIIQSNDMYGLSIGYIVTQSYKQDGIRYITQAHLVEVSLVKTPANDKAIINKIITQRTGE